MTPTAAVRSILGDPSGTLSEDRCREVVVAVLRACREPSEGMITAGSNKPAPDWPKRLYVFLDDPSPVYRAMIDALIEEVQCSAG